MGRKRAERPIDAESLQLLLRDGAKSDVLLARIAYAQAEAFSRYVRPLVGQTRAYPDMLPTQSPGRWSLSNPPVITWPDDAKAEKRGLPKLRRIVVPDPGTFWVCWDWDGMHARFTAAACDDKEDLRAFAEGLDLHTITAARMFGFPLPPDLRDPHKAPSAEAWRRALKWEGKGDRRRHLAKTVRYALLNGLDERAVLEADEVVEQGLDFEELLEAGRLYLRSKPNYVAWKRQYIEKCLADGWARSLYGRRLKLLGDRKTKAKAAISHFLQGTESDILALTLDEVLNRRYPQAWLVYPSHDGVKIAFPASGYEPSAVIDNIRPFVERSHRIGKHDIALPATWDVVRPGEEH